MFAIRFPVSTIVLLFWVGLCVSGCSKTPAEEAILKNIESMQQAVEDGVPRKAVEFLDDEFTGNRGVDKMGLRRILIAALFRHANIRINITRMDISVNPRDPFLATMNCVAIFSGADNLLPQDGRIYQISGEWQYKNGEWLLMRANWE